MADRWERSVRCLDAHGRTRQLVVFVSDDNLVGLLTPPGEAAALSPDGVKRLQAALVSASIEATHRGAEQ